MVWSIRFKFRLILCESNAWIGKPVSDQCGSNSSLTVLTDYFPNSMADIYIPENTIHRGNVDTMLAHRLRRWADIEPAFAQCILFAGI